jgi:archaellum component FlaF (FlaF/FlaG flagellin family)
LIAYYATRYSDDESEENKKYKKMHENQFTDISKTELYIYSIEHGVEYKITNNGGQVLSPIFYDDTSIVYVLVSGGKYELHSAKLTIDNNGDVSASELKAKSNNYKFE